MPTSAQKKSTSQQQQKQGGNLVSDIQNLAVPFAILLAKQGLEGVFKSKPEKPVKAKSASSKTPAKKAEAAPAESKPKATQRRKTISGGSSCTSAAGCAGLKGGSSCRAKQGGYNASVGERFDDIAKQVKSFLEKY